MSALEDALALTPAAGVETQLAQPLSFSVPLIDHDEFNGLKSKRRSEVNVTLRILERIHGLRNEPRFVQAVNTLAQSYRHLHGFSGSRLYAKYTTYVKSGGNWRSIVKGYKAPSHQPNDFQEFVRGLIEQNKGEVAAALEQLRDDIWPSGEAVPGYGTWQEFFRAKYPHLDVPAHFPRIWPQGWSERNLRRYGPTRAEIALFSGGMAAAHGSLPKLIRDTSKLRPMQWIAIDDFQLDVMCKFSGDPARGLKPQIAYVGGLMAKCVGTRKTLACLFGPMVEREEKQADGTVKKVRSYVKQLDVQALLYTLFRENGVPRDYDVTIICENKTATITPAQELMLKTLFGDRIRVHRTSLIEHKTLVNGFVETGGTPWEKGWIESDFNYRWNRLKKLPGYKGSNERLNAPGDHEAKLALSAKFLGQGKGQLNLPPEIITELPLPFLSVEELTTAFNLVNDRAERRVKHKMLGFDTVTEFRWPDPKLPAPAGIDTAGPNNFRALALLAPAQQALMIPDERKECILERWERLTAAHPRSAVSPAALSLFLLTPNKARWRSHAVTFTRAGVGYSYIDDEGQLPPALAEGTELLAYVDFNAPESAVICGLDGATLAVLRMLGGSPRGVDITDTAAVDAARARRAEVVNRVLARVRARPLHQAADAQLATDARTRDQLVAAYQAETAHLPLADKIGAEAARQQEKAHVQRREERATESEQAAVARLIAKHASAESTSDYV